MTNASAQSRPAPDRPVLNPVPPGTGGSFSALEREFLPPLLEIEETPPSPVQRGVVITIVALTVTLIVWSVFGRLDIVATATGKVIPDGKVKVLQPIATSVIRAIHVRDGQAVHVGDLLLELDPTVSAAALKADREKLTLLREQVKNAAPLVESGALSQKDYYEMKRALAEAEADAVQAKQNFDLEWLRAPVDGVVQNVAVTTLGAVVTPAQTLVTIVPQGTSLIVEAMVSNDDIGFVKTGEPVEIKFDTFPFQKYGTVRGTVTWVSPDAEDTSQSLGQVSPENPNATGSTNGSSAGAASVPNSSRSLGLTYRVHIMLAQSAMNVDGRSVPFSSGMTLKADIITDQRRVIEFFLSPIVKYLDEGLKVR